MVALHDRTEAGHAVDAFDSTTGFGLLQAATDQVFAGPFHLTASST
jgi:hypothetical protein